MAIHEPTTWTADCDKCGCEYDGEIWECEDEDSVIEALEADGWVYDSNNDEWLCPECASESMTADDEEGEVAE